MCFTTLTDLGLAHTLQPFKNPPLQRFSWVKSKHFLNRACAGVFFVSVKAPFKYDFFIASELKNHETFIPQLKLRHSSTRCLCVYSTFEEKKANPALKIQWYVTTHTPSSLLSRFITELKKPCRSSSSYDLTASLYLFMSGSNTCIEGHCLLKNP